MAYDLIEKCLAHLNAIGGRIRSLSIAAFGLLWRNKACWHHRDSHLFL